MTFGPSRLVFGALLSGSLVLLQAVPARADCLPDTVCDVNGCYVNVVPQFSHSGSKTNGSSAAGYDLIHLQFDMESNAYGGDLVSSFAWVLAQDVYTASGVSAGTSLDLQLSLFALGFAGSSGSFQSAGGSVSVVSPAGTTTLTGPMGPPGVDTTMTIALHVIAGFPFTIQYRASGGCVSGFSNWSGQCAFVNLPAGVVVTSCEGYVSGSAVAARRTTFGRLKALYR